MPNHSYIISEVQFFSDKENEQNTDFIQGTEINLAEACTSRMPNLLDIRKALSDFGLVTKEISYSDNRVEITTIQNNDVGLWLIFDKADNENKKLNMFEVGSGSNADLIINFVKFLGKTHGNFLYVFSGGGMSLITPNKSNEKIIGELTQFENKPSLI
jgi:hypothetical protein